MNELNLKKIVKKRGERKMEYTKYSKYESKLETLVTIITYGETALTLKENLHSTLDSCKKISNGVKKNSLCNSIYRLIQRVEVLEETEKVNSIFFLSEEENLSEEYVLTKKEIQTLQEYQFKTFIYRPEERFIVEELKDIFTNFDFLQTIQMNQLNVTHRRMNRYKQKECMTMKVTNDTQVIEALERIKKEENVKDQKIIVYGQSPILNQLKNRNLSWIICKDQNMTKEEIWSLNEDEKMRENLRILEERMRGIQDEKKVDLYVFGRIKIEIKEHIDNYLLKELFIEERKIKILEGIVEPESLNFKIYPIRSLEKGDIGDRFIEEYKGLMGIKYF